MSSTCDTIRMRCESHDVYMSLKLINDVFEEGPVVDRLKAVVSRLSRTQLLVDSIFISTYTPQYFQSRRVTGHTRLSRTCLFFYLSWPNWTVSLSRLLCCYDYSFCSLWPLPLFILDELLVHRCGLYLCSVSVALSLIEQELRLHLLSVMVRRRVYRYRLSFLPLHELWMFFRGNVVTSVFAFQSYLGLTTRSFPITSGTILEEPLYLEKGHFATLLASPFVAVPLWLFHGIVEGT